MKSTFTVVLFLSILFFGYQTETQAQRNCGTMEYLEQQIESQPDLLQKMDEIERFTERYIESQAGEARGEIYTIPVVVHVVYKTNAQNISDAQIFSQIQILNEDFRRMNADADNTWSQAADSEIEFCLATIAPDGSSTSGIQRRKTNKPSFSANDNVKFNNKGGLNAWPAADYLNIWVCNLGSGLLGYAQFPGGNPATDGVVNDYAYFGDIGTATAPYDLGRTCTHEVGHWLNLRHIWGDGGCSVDDFVSDTPLSDASNGGCAVGHVSCGSVDMVQNYMDYSYDSCMNLYTSGQSDRMRALFGPGGERVSLLSSQGCGGGTPPPDPEICDNGIDDDGDGLTDCEDPDCSNASNCQTSNPEICDNGIDDDGDGLTDCADSDCSNASNCQPTGSCDTPTGLFASNIKPKKARLNWDAVGAASSYNVQIRAVGGNWQTFNTGGTSINISGLSNGTTYEWQVQSVCGGESSAYSSPVCSFTAGNSGSGACTSSRVAVLAPSFEIFPNPATDQINVHVSDAISGTTSISILDLYGKVVMSIQEDQFTQRAIALGNLQSGLYLIRLDYGDGEYSIKKFMIAK
ncbi:MAG: T9SS type A sorting domain-containing protein [Saprospiraceae bacterium]|nr:T9SS type A sorting domain-containing protein [Saprospiraceae bacterium]